MLRETEHINRRVTQSAFRAFDYAKVAGPRLNTYVVINIRDTAERGATTAFEKIRHKFRDWLGRRAKLAGADVPPIYVFAFENPNGLIHVNWAVHIPEKLATEFSAKLPKWVEKVQGKVEPFDIDIQPVESNYDKRLAKYIFKGTDPHFVTHFHLQDIHEPQGKIWGRRAAVSQAIGIRARKKAGFKPVRRSILGANPPCPPGVPAAGRMM
jgi:hypothetical protein